MDFTSLKNFIDKTVEEYKVPGADCIVYKDHKELFRYYSGYSDRENGVLMSGNELYYIFSLTKFFTCTAALQLFEKGRFLLDDPVSKFLPEFEKMKISADEYEAADGTTIATGASMGENAFAPGSSYAKTPITMRHLFTMTAGLDYDIMSEHIKKTVAKGRKSTRDIVRAIGCSTLHFEPGTHYRYSLCHDVLGGVIEVISGKSLGKYMKENIFEPLDMKDTFFAEPKSKEQKKRMAALYTHTADGIPKREPLSCCHVLSDEYESGGAGLVSCADDCITFADAMANGGVGKNGKRILSSRTVNLMKTNHLSGVCTEEFYTMKRGYGYGLGVRTHSDPLVSGSVSPIGEFGADGAAGAFVLSDTENALSAVYFQHVFNWDIRLQNEFRNVVYKCLED